jgi:hypothetical protein
MRNTIYKSIGKEEEISNMTGILQFVLLSGEKEISK